MKKLIINADDFGLCDSVNRGILDCLKYGLVTDVSFMVNKNEFETAHQLLSEEGITKVGFHLNLTMGESICGQKSTLTDATGKFFQNKSLFFRIINGKILASDIYVEIKAQMELLKNLGYTITHIDSHTNIHLIPVIFDTILQISREMNLKVPIRVPLERQINFFKVSKTNLVRIFVLNLLSWYVSLRMGYHSKIHTIGGDFFNNSHHSQVFDQVLQRIIKSKYDIFELAVHPGIPSEQIGLYDGYNEQRKWEFNFLRQKQNFKFASEITLCSFKDLQENELIIQE